MSNLAGLPPQPKHPKAKPNPAYLREVRMLRCAACGKPGPSEAHHCRDIPPFDEQGLYEQLPGTARKSGDRDAIPLCPDDHRLFHASRRAFHALYGPDYSYIGPTRAHLSTLEIEF
jgi:hypothetical protein